MEYPFKDLMPLDEVLAREGYYKDWTHLDPEVFYSLTQISEYIKTKGYGVDVRLLIAQLAEHFGLKTSQINEIERLFNDVMTELGEEKDYHSLPEIAGARGGFDTLGERLNDTTAQLAQTDYEATRKRQLEDLDEEVLSAIEGGEGTSFNLLSIPQDESVTMDKIAFKKKSTNLFNKDSALKGYYVSTNSGNLMESSSFQVSGFITIEPETDYFIKRVRHYVFYDENEERITGASPSGTDLVISSPANARYLRISWEIDSYNNTQQVNRGSEELPFEAFYEFIKSENVEKWSITSADVVDGSLGPGKTTFVKPSKNLFNKETILQGYFVYQTSGNISGNGTAEHYASEFIEVKPSEFYTFSRSDSTTRYAFYTKDKEFIEGGISPDLPIQVPQNASYIRFSQGAYISPDTLQFEQNTTPTNYEPFGLTIPNLLMDAETIGEDEVLVHLPREISIAVGRTIELYNNQVVWAGNIENYHIQWVSSIGKAYERKWSFTGEVGNIGTYNLTINVFDNNMKLVTSANTTVKVASNVLSETYNLLSIGDSLTNQKPWLNELETLSNSKIKNIGTRQGRHEGRSGGSANWFLSDSTYTFDSSYDESNPDTDGTENPFWNPTTQKFDFDYYKTTYNKTPDAVQIFLGTNGLALDPTTNADNIKAIVDGIRASDTTIPIFVVNTLYRSGQDGMANQASNDGYSSFRSAWKLQEDRKVFNLMVKLDELLNDYSNVHFVPVALTHDSEYNYGQVEISVNPRSEITTMIPNESVHPQNEGYMQMADIMFSTMVANLE